MMNERELSYSERMQVKVAKETARLLGISWDRIVSAFAWPDDGPSLREYRAADETFAARKWGKITDWKPCQPKKGDWLWLPELGLVRVEMCGEKRAKCSQETMSFQVTPETLGWGMRIPAEKVPLVRAAIMGFYCGYRASGHEVYNLLNLVSALKIRFLLQDIVKNLEAVAA